MMRNHPMFCLFLALLIFQPVLAQQRFLQLGDFPVHEGGVIRNCVIGYRTFGTLNSARTNVILFPTWLGGRSEDLQSLLGPERLVDTTRYFVVAADAFGDGVSSSPSNSTAQPGKAFPRVTIGDMVRAQKALLDSLGIARLHAVVGGSMGGMQALEWAVRYPELMAGIVAYVPTPKLTSADLLLWNTELTALDIAERYAVSDSLQLRLVAMINGLAIQTPSFRTRTTKPEEFPVFLRDYVAGFKRRFIPDDWRTQLQAVCAHDISLGFGGSLEKAAAAVKARTMIIVASQDHMVNPGPAIDFAQRTGARLLVLENDCGHLAPSCAFERFTAEVRSFLRSCE